MISSANSDDVHEVLAVEDVRVDELGDLAAPSPVGAAEHVREDHRQQQDRAGEDDRDDAGLVDLQRDVGVLAAVHPAADHTFGELHRYPPLAELDEHDGDDDPQRQRHDQRGTRTTC